MQQRAAVHLLFQSFNRSSERILLSLVLCHPLIRLLLSQPIESES